MNILLTGAKGFVGKNLAEALKNIRDNKDRTRNLKIGEIFLYDVDSKESELDEYIEKADIVFHFAGVNRPQSVEEFKTGNCDFTQNLLDKLKEYGNTCPVVLSSSVQATLEGRFKGSDYGLSKLQAENAVFAYGEETGASVYVYRFPNLFGKWCRPNYNSAVATFCHNIANGLEIKVNDPTVELELVYIDDLVCEMLDLIEGNAHSAENGFFAVPVSHKVRLGEIAALLYRFSAQPETLVIPEIPENSFEKKLYSTYLSYLPKEKICVPLKMNVDGRGSFTELFKSEKCGQVSVNISKPGIMKGQHWHHSKWEFFVVVKGRALISQRKIDSDEVINFEVSGENITAVHMLPGYTHNIYNLSDTEELVTVMWANEAFDPQRPDTFFEEV